MKISNKGIDFIKQFEGLSLEVYKDIVGKKTIGYGHLTDKEVGEKITEEEAENYLKTDIARIEHNVSRYNTIYHFLQNEYDSLVSFAFNIGSIDQLTDNGKRGKSTIAEKMLLYYNSGGKKIQGLVERRKKERLLFLNGDYGMVNDVEYIDNSDDVVQINYKTHGNTKASENFIFKEFIANGTELRKLYDKGTYNILLVSRATINICQKVRSHFGKPVQILSGYRPLEYNVKCGGATKSQHILGTACDIRVSGIDTKDVCLYLDELLGNYGGLGYYKGQNFVHFDTRLQKVRWVQPTDAKSYKTVQDIKEHL